MTARAGTDAFTVFEREGWDRIPRGYDDFIGPVTARAADPLLDAAAVGREARVLDVATGPGYIAGRALERGAEVVGVDISAEILLLARARHPGLAVRVADAAALPFDDATFDAVVSGFLLPHLADHDRVLAECRRVLVPGGVVAVSTWDRPERVPLVGAFAEAVAAAGARPPADLPAGPPFFAYSDEEALAGLLERAGLGDVAVARHGFVHRVASADALWDGVLGGTVRTSALVTSQPEPVRREIRSAFDRLVAGYESGGGLDIPVSVLVARGTR